MNQNAVGSLMRLGFSEDEAQTYCALLEESPLSGYAIAQKTGIARSHIYEVIEKLYRRGCITVSYGGASEYAAIPYTQMLENLSNASRADRHEAVKQTQRFMSGSKKNNVIRNIYGSKDIYNTLKQLILETKDYIMMKLWAKDIMVLEPELVHAKKCGVELHLIVLGKYTGKELEYYNYEDVKETGEFRPVSAAFGNRIVFCGSISDRDGGTCFATENYCLKLPIHSTLLFDLELAELYRGDSGLLKEKFGDDVELLRKEYC